MTSRREFIREAAGAGIVSSVALPAFAMRKGILGAHNTSVMPTAASWDNPYVMDGLIAMWDGEWNAGYGEHNDSAETWFDLSGNGYLLEGEKFNCSWTSNSVLLGAGGYGKCIIPNINNYQSVTVEFVGRFTNTYVSSTSTDMGVNITGRGRGSAFISNVTNDNALVGVAIRSDSEVIYHRPSDTTRYVSAVRSYALHTYTFCSSYYAKIGLDGEYSPKVKYYWHTSNGIDDSSEVRVGSLSKTPIEMTNIRMYNRELTSDEVAFNYAVDKERFGE